MTRTSRGIALVFALLLVDAALAAKQPVKQSAKQPECVAARGRAKVAIESKCRHMEHAGQTRTYRLYTPKTLRSPAPLLLALHGGGGSGSNMEGLTLKQFDRLADRNGFIVVYPDGVGRGWNDGRNDPRSEAVEKNVDDVGFLRALIERIGEQFSVDRKRIYATGISNGGLMSYRLACDAADIFAAVAPVAANMAAELAPECKPSQPVSVFIVNGRDDPMMPWIGGQIKVLWTRRGAVLSAQASFEHWTAFNDCALPISHNPTNRAPDDGTSLMRHVARECTDNTEVRLYEIIGGGHTWPSGDPYLGDRAVGKVSREINASDAIWQFFAQHARP